MTILSRVAIDNVWRHWWAGHIEAVGGHSLLPLDPIVRASEPIVRPAIPRRSISKLSRDIGEMVDRFLESILSGSYEENVRKLADTRGMECSAIPEINNREGRRAISRSLRRNLSAAKRAGYFNYKPLTQTDLYLSGEILSSVGRGNSRYRDDNIKVYPLDFACVFGDQGGVDTTTRISLIQKPNIGKARMLRKDLLPPDIDDKVMRIQSTDTYINFNFAMFSDGSIGCNLPYGRFPDGWRAIALLASGANLEWTESRTDQINNLIEETLAQSNFSRNHWHAALNRPGNRFPRIVIPTSPTGCLDLFRSRDLAPGERRRSALRHWVNEHYRERSTDPRKLAYVREHLRGNQLFKWNGLDCELMVSAADIDKNEMFRVRPK